jgi:hypothetical protein
MAEGIVFSNPKSVANPYKTASLAAIVNDEFIFTSSIAGWEPNDAAPISDVSERAAQSFRNVLLIGKEIGADKNKLLESIFSDGNSSGLALFQYGQEILEQYGGVVQEPSFDIGVRDHDKPKLIYDASKSRSLRSEARNLKYSGETYTPLTVTYPEGDLVPILSTFTGISETAGDFATTGVFYIKNATFNDGVRKFVLENTPFTDVYRIDLFPASHIASTEDRVFSGETRAYVKIPIAGWIPSELPVAEQVPIVWDFIREKMAWAGVSPNQVYRLIIIEAAGNPGATLSATLAAIHAIWGAVGPFPAVEYFVAPPFLPSIPVFGYDVRFEAYVPPSTTFSGKQTVEYGQFGIPYIPQPSFNTFSSAVKTGRYVHTSALLGVNADGQTWSSTVQGRLFKAFENAIVAAAQFGARAVDAYKVIVRTSHPVNELASDLDVVSQLYWGINGPFPVRVFEQIQSNYPSCSNDLIPAADACNDISVAIHFFLASGECKDCSDNPCDSPCAKEVSEHHNEHRISNDVKKKSKSLKQDKHKSPKHDDPKQEKHVSLKQETHKDLKPTSDKKKGETPTNAPGLNDYIM